MRLTRIRCRDFLSFGSMELAMGDRMVVVTGPNGAGKSNLGQAVDLVRTVIGNYGGRQAADLLSLYTQAGRNEAASFEVSLDLTLDQPWEQDLVAAFMRSVYVCGTDEGHRGITRAERDRDLQERLDPGSVAPLHAGTLLVAYDAKWPSQWFAAWEFTAGEDVWHIQLVGGTNLLRHGPIDSSRRVPRDRIPTLAAKWDEVLPYPPEGPLPTLADRIDFMAMMPKHGESVSLGLTVPNDGSAQLPDSVFQLARGIGVSDATNRSFDFTGILAEVLHRGIVLTDNRRLPMDRRFTLEQLQQPADLHDGRAVAAELFRLKNGSKDLRERYRQTKDYFGQLTGRSFGLQVSSGTKEPGSFLLDVTVVDGEHERPIAFAGAGIQEALLLATLLTGDPGRAIILDEPAVNLEPTVQRRLVRTLGDRAQCLVITHSADMVPVNSVADLASVVRLAPDPKGSKVHRVSADLTKKEEAKWLQRLGLGDVRALLFASRVILCEGSTDVGALGTWWEAATRPGWVTPGAANIPLVDVGGHNGFVTFIDYLDAFGIPWAIVADGPALRPGSDLALHLDKLSRPTGVRPADDAKFESWQAYWQTAGVFTLATTFGDDGSKGGEIEVLLKNLDSNLYAEVENDVGRRSKPRAGALFATRRPKAPAQVLDLYEDIKKHFGQ